MSAQTQIALISQLADQVGVKLPESVTAIINRYGADRITLAGIGDVQSADPAPTGQAVAAAIRAGRDPLSDKCTARELRRYLVARFTAVPALNALSAQALAEIRDREDELMDAFGARYSEIIDDLSSAHETLKGADYSDCISCPVVRVIGRGASALAARMKWDEAIAQLDLLAKLYQQVFTPGPLMWWHYGEPAGELRETLIEHDEWAMNRTDHRGLLIWELLAADSFTFQLAAPDKAAARIQSVEAERAQWMANQPQHGHSPNRPVVVQL